MNGILVADKPEGWTSHGVVAEVKRKLKAKKVGHLGTLDPLATGVLPLVINGATRYARFLDGGVKRYEAVMKLGEETDTYDREGRVIKASDASSVRPEDVIRALESFRGMIKQVPPMYSAIKMNGTPLYKLARKGVVIEREARDVNIMEIEALEADLPYFGFMVACSRGTYVRSICHDAGRILGCGAHLVSLRRTGCGEFAASESISPLAPADDLIGRIIPVDEALRRSEARLPVTA